MPVVSQRSAARLFREKEGRAIKKKLGPLELWQWIAIGVAVGLGSYVWRRTHPSAATLPAQSPAASAFNPIDPTTGMPIAGGISTGGDTSQTGAPTLAQELQDLASIEGLLAGLQQVAPGPAVETDQSTISSATGAAPSKPAKKAAPAGPSLLDRARARVAQGGGGATTIRELEHAGYSLGQIRHAQAHHVQLGNPKNPGHKTTSHKGGRKSPSSSAPHNPRQHKNVAPPSHQRHNTTKHPSARRRHR